MSTRIGIIGSGIVGQTLAKGFSKHGYEVLIGTHTPSKQQQLKEKTGGSVPMMGRVEGALAEANDLRGDTALLTDLYDRPEWVRELLEICVETEIAFARAQVEAGVREDTAYLGLAPDFDSFVYHPRPRKSARLRNKRESTRTRHQCVSDAIKLMHPGIGRACGRSS